MANSGQWLDLMLYTNAENSAVYAVVCDNESGSIAYAAYQVPAYFGEDDFAVEMMAFFNGENEYMMIDHIHIAEGSLRQYLRENMPAYTENKQRVDAFLNQDVSVLPQMVFKPMNGPETILNLQFDSQEDAGWLEIHGENTENIVPQDCVKDGVFALEQEAALKYILEPGQMVHIRAKASGIMRDGSVYFIDLNPVGSPALPRERPLWLRFNVGSNEPYRLEAQRPSGYAPLTPADSAMLARADELVDVLVWLDDQDQSVRYIISDPNSAADIACIGVMLDEEYVSDGWNVSLQVNTIGGNDASSGGDLQTDIAFIRASTGPIKAYLEQNIPAYSAHQARVDAFLAETMPLISELETMPYG